MVDPNKIIADIMQIADKLDDKAGRTIERELRIIYKRGLDKTRLLLSYFYEKHGRELTFAEAVKYGRLDKLEKEVAESLKGVNKEANAAITNALKNSYSDNYYWHTYAIDSSFNAGISFALLSKDDIRAALLNPYDRVTWPKRLAGHTKQLQNQLRGAVTDALLRGQGVDKAAKNLRQADWFKTALNNSKGHFNSAAAKAKTIMWTETHRASEAGRAASWEKAKGSAGKLGIEMLKKWDATLDLHTRPSHRALDQQVSDENGFFTLYGKKVAGPGNTGFPAEDIHCRCSARAYFPDMPNKYRFDNIDKKIISNQSYKEWLEKRSMKQKRKISKAKVKTKASGARFVPAKTVKEAEALSVKKGAILSDYDGFNVNKANAINRALDIVPKEAIPEYIGNSKNYKNVVGIPLTRRAKDFYAVTRKSSGNYPNKVLSRTGISEIEGLKTQAGTFQAYGEQQTIFFSNAYKDFDATTERKIQINKYYKKEKGQEWFFNTDGNLVPVHEMGHVYDNRKYISGSAEWKQLADKWYKETKFGSISTNSEAFAEAFADYFGNKAKRIPGYIKDFFDKEVK